jgi:hypothetical protein
MSVPAIVRSSVVALAAIVPLVAMGPVGAVEGDPVGVDDNGDLFFDIDLGELLAPPEAPGGGEAPAPTDPSAPAPSDLVPVVTEPSPAGPGDGGAGPNAPTPPEGLPEDPAQFVQDALAGAGEGGGEGEAQDPCAQATGPLTEGGAPIAASCPIRQTEEGGVDVGICLTIATIATCEQENKPADNDGGNDIGNGGGGGTAPTLNGSGSESTPTEMQVASAAAPSGSSGGTLPFTGAAIALVAGIGTALAATGTLTNRLAADVARRRAS